MSSLFEKDGKPAPSSQGAKKEARTLDQLKDLDTKIVEAIVKIKTLKEENAALQARLKEMGLLLEEKDSEIKALSAEKKEVKGQIQQLLDELESIGVS